MLYIERETERDRDIEREIDIDIDIDVCIGRDMEIYKNRDAPMNNAEKTTLEQKQESRHLRQLSR